MVFKKKKLSAVMLTAALLWSMAGLGQAVYAERPQPQSDSVFTSLSVEPVAAGLQVADLNGVLTVTDLVYKIVGSSVEVRNVSYTGAKRAAGTFSGGEGIGLPEGVVLSSGRADGIVGPNGTDRSESNGQPGDSSLNGLTSGTTGDAAVLEFDFMPNHEYLTFQYLLSSDEYPNFIEEDGSSSYNDVMGIFVNGMNVAGIPGSNPSAPVSVSSINHIRNNHLYRDNTSLAFHFGMNGLTQVLTAESPVTKNDWNHLKIAIADFGDSSYDSNLLIKGGSITSRPAENGTLSVGQTVYGFNIAANKKTAGFHVVRSGGSDGAVSAKWTVTDQINGEQTGVVQFNPQEMEKSVPVQFPVNAAEATFTLSEPAGGVTLGTPSSITVRLDGGLQVSGAGGIHEISTQGGTLAITAKRTDGASVTGVTYAVYGMDGLPTALASIGTDGLLTANGNGQVKVVVIAEGGYYGVAHIAIRNQLSELVITLQHTLDDQDANLSDLPIQLVRESDDLMLEGTSDEIGTVHVDHIPAGTWAIYVWHPFYIHAWPGKIVLGDTNSATVDLTVLSLDRQQDDSVDITDIVWFAANIKERKWDFNGDGGSGATDLEFLLNRVEPQTHFDH